MSRLKKLWSVATDVRWWRFYLQRRVSNPSLRRRIGDYLARRQPPWYFRDGVQDDLQNNALQRRGFVRFGQLLSRKQCAEVLGYLSRCEVTDPYRPDQPGFLPEAAGRAPHSHVGYHRPIDVLRAPHLLEVANRADVLDCVASFLGCKPTIDYLAAWWSYPTGLPAAQAENFHRDVDDFRFVKLFLYLTDVGTENGPHVYVSSSAEDRRLRKLVRLTDEEVDREFGSSNIQIMTGNAGDAFVENTVGIHKGQPLQAGHRVIFQAVYTVSGTPYGPKTPVLALDELPCERRQDLDRWINRIYLSDSSAE